MAPLWEIKRKGAMLQGVGEQALLKAPLTAFFASRQCPGSAIRAAMSWALEQAQKRQGVISGFHSPLEQSVLQLLLQTKSPVVALLARPVADARLPPGWQAALAGGHMAVASMCDLPQRLTREHARERNEQAARLSDAIVTANIGCLTHLQSGSPIPVRHWVELLDEALALPQSSSERPA